MRRAGLIYICSDSQFNSMTEYPKVEDCVYFTNRALENEKMEKKGHILMWRRRGEEQFHMILTCPYCGQKQERDEKFEGKPYRPICEKCGKTITIEKMLKKKKASSKSA